ncbi:SAICAR synthase-like protein [Violaceomyces palustris]|uniref:SAICAR synthase-like protein n=1 Tax=Violaceomyces palustris TaxID=1673888 RepID=A0ACD0NPI4_9BASI|nr:SAICAR synthase-like protein [Violaceomyces palustris]
MPSECRVENLADLEPLSTQVAGHEKGVLQLQGGQKVVKSCLPLEVEFYETLSRPYPLAKGGGGQSELVERLSRLIPSYHGSLNHRVAEYLSEQQDDDPIDNRDDLDAAVSSSVKRDPASPAPPPTIVLENLTHPFKCPNVCDIKLGTQLWDEGSSPEKRRRMENVARETTSFECGLRLTGWKTYDNSSKTYHAVGKGFGKAIGPESLPLGIRMILSSPLEGDAKEVKAKFPEKVPLPPSAALPHLPKELVRPLVEQGIKPFLHEAISIFSSLHVRIRGGSVLLVYEGDRESLRAGLEEKSTSGDVGANTDAATTTTLKAGKVGEGITKRVFDARFIDFGHAALVDESEGIDQGVLKGLKYLLSLVEDFEASL